MHSRSGAVARLVLLDLLGSIVWFPVWWYTKGFLKVASAARGALRFRVAQYGFRIWMRNFFVPMYGQHDLTGRIVSVVMRFIVLIGRAIGLVVEATIYVGGLLVWLAAPVVFILFLLGNAAGIFLYRI